MRGLLVRYRKILLSMMLITALCCGTTIGLINAYRSLERTIDRYQREYGVADAVISTETTRESDERVLEALPGIARVESRLTAVERFYTPTGRLLNAYVATMNREEIQTLHHWTQDPDTAGDHVFIDINFALANSLAVGDRIRVPVGEEYRPFRIAGLVSAPETMSGAKMKGFDGEYSDIGYIYVPVSLLEEETAREFRRMMAEWEEKQQEYLQAEQEAQDSLEQGESALQEAWEELEIRQKDFEQTRSDLQEQLKSMTDARFRLMRGQRELEEAETTAEERRAQLEQGLEKASAQLLELEDSKAQMEEIRNDLNTLLVRLEDAKGRLTVARGKLDGTAGELGVTLTALRGARTVWDEVRSSGAVAELPEIVENQVQISAAELEEKLRQNGITPETLDDTIRQAEQGASQLQSGRSRIQDGISQISRVYLPELQNYIEETEQGLELVSESIDALKGAIGEMEAGLQAIGEFEAEAPESREELNRKLEEVEEGIRSIYAGLEEGEAALTEGRKQLEEKNDEADAARREAQEELSEGAESLNDALEELNAWEGYTPLRNEFLLEFDPDVRDRQALLDSAAEALGEIVLNSTLYENSYAYKRIRDELLPWDTLALFVPILFTAIVMMVLFLFLTLMIRQSRREIGILRALGFSVAQTRSLFCLLSFLIMIPALAAGAALSLPLRNYFDDFYQRIHSFPLFAPVFDTRMFLLLSLGMIAATQLAAVLTTSAIGRVDPAETMTRQAAGYRPVSLRAKRICNGLDPLTRLSVISLGRNKLRFISASLCIAGAVGIMFTAMAFLSARGQLDEDLFERRIHYDCQILFTGEPEAALAEEIRRMPSVAKLENAQSFTAEILFAGRTEQAALLSLEPGTDLISVTDEAGRPMPMPGDGIVLEENRAKALGARAGDTVTVNGVPMTVAMVSRQLGSLVSYIPADRVPEMGTAPQYSWLVRLNGGDGEALNDRLRQEETYVMTVMTPVLRDSMYRALSTFDIFAWVAVLFAVVLGFFIINNTNQTNLQEQKRELSILRALGFTRGAISLHWFVHSLLYFITALAAGFPLGILMVRTAFAQLKYDSKNFIFIPEPFEFLVTAGVLFLFLAAAHLWTMRSIRKWDIAENVRDME